MLSVEHANYDAKESRNDRHAFKFTASRNNSGRSNGLTFSRKPRENRFEFGQPLRAA